MENINKVFGNRIRVRVCGICIQNHEILLVNQAMGAKGELWLPPGGGVDFNECAEDALIREFKEETGLEIAVQHFMFVNEYKCDQLHAIELFFKVNQIGGSLEKGIDPELSDSEQIITALKFVSFEQIAIMNDELLHDILHGNISEDKLLNMSGYFKLCQ